MPPISVELALIAGRAVFLVFCFVLAAIAFTRWRRSADRSTAQFVEQTAVVLERIGSLEARLEALQGSHAELIEKLAATGNASGSTAPSYQIAVRMARSGATREDLISSCGVTRQEADLLQRLHAPATRTRIATVS